MKSSNPLISQVSLFLNQGPGLLIDGENGSRPVRSETDKARYMSLLGQQQFIFWAEALPQARQEKEALAVSLIQKVPITVEPSYGALIVDVRREELRALLQQLNPAGQGTAFLLDKDGGYLVREPDNGGGEGTERLDERIRAEMAQSPQENGSLTYEFDRETYVVSYGRLKNTGWLYASATPLSHLTKPVEMIARLPLAASLLGLLVAVLLSWFASKQLSRPLQHLMQVFGYDKRSAGEATDGEIHFIENRWNYVQRERTDLQVRWERALPALREGFLLQLVQGHLSALPAERISEQLRQFDFPVEDRQYSMLLIQLYGFSNAYSDFARGDEQLITFAAANIAEEVMARQALIINFQDLTVGVLVHSPSDWAKARIKSWLFDSAQRLIDPLQSYLKLRAVVGVSRISPSLKGLPRLLEDVRQAIRFRDTEAGAAIVDAEETVPRREGSMPYPFMQENMLIQALQMGQEAQARDWAEQFMQALQEASTQEFIIQQGMLQLLGNVQFAMLQIGCNPQQVLGGVNMYDRLLHIREPEAMLAWFQRELLAPFIAEIESIKDLQTKQIVDKVLALLKEQFMHDISLEMCADRFGTYPQKLSVSFRQHVGVNFIDYLTSLRLSKSKELLIGTDMKINDIAEQVGYQPTYYNRIFRKHEGMTPGQYREKHTAAAGK